MKRLTIIWIFLAVCLVGCETINEAYVDGTDELGNKSGLFDRHDTLAKETNTFSKHAATCEHCKEITKDFKYIGVADDDDTLSVWLRSTKLFREHIEEGKKALKKED